MADEQQAGNGSGNACTLIGCDAEGTFRMDIMAQPTAAYLCGEHARFIRQFSLAEADDAER